MVIKPKAKSIGVSKRIRPPHIALPIQLNILTPVGIAQSIVKTENADVATIPMPVVKHMVAPVTAKPIKPIRKHRKIQLNHNQKVVFEKNGDYF